MIESEGENISTRFDRDVNVVVGYSDGKPFYRILVVDLNELRKGTLVDWSKVPFDVVHVARFPGAGDQESTVKELTPKGFEKLIKILPGQQQVDGVLDGVEKIQKARKILREEKEKKRKEMLTARTKKASSD
jgi:hypothetical protein